MKVTIVGCGLAGISAARALRDKGHNVRIFETRLHIGGNCFDSCLNGTLVHNYGPHIFHTDDDGVFQFLSRFTEWFPFQHRIKANTELGLLSLPYSLKTVEELGRAMSDDEVTRYIFRDYSEKQWGIPFSELPPEIVKRVPTTRKCKDPTWFEGQKHQCMPLRGYTKMMEEMLHGIPVELGCEQNAWRKEKSDLVIFTGRIDQFFNYRFGVLGYRTLRFKHEVTARKMDHAVQNETTHQVPYTRVYDHHRFMAWHTGLTVITHEYSESCGIDDAPYYPMRIGANVELIASYQAEANKLKDVIFLGRLGTYSYMDMWKVVRQALDAVKAL